MRCATHSTSRSKTDPKYRKEPPGVQWTERTRAPREASWNDAWRRVDALLARLRQQLDEVSPVHRRSRRPRRRLPGLPGGFAARLLLEYAGRRVARNVGATALLSA